MPRKQQQTSSCSSQPYHPQLNPHHPYQDQEGDVDVEHHLSASSSSSQLSLQVEVKEVAVEVREVAVKVREVAGEEAEVAAVAEVVEEVSRLLQYPRLHPLDPRLLLHSPHQSLNLAMLIRSTLQHPHSSSWVLLPYPLQLTSTTLYLGYTSLGNQLTWHPLLPTVHTGTLQSLQWILCLSQIVITRMSS